MTPEQMRIVIAEKVGWKQVMTRENGNIIGVPPDGSNYVHIGGSNDWAFVPDYCNDLNAMHEAENCICSGDYQAHLPMRERKDFNYLYRLAITQIVGTDIHRATALQRAEAFIEIVCPERWIEQ